MAAPARLHASRQSLLKTILLLTAVGLVVYWPALSGGFIFDDDTLLTHNPMVQAANGLYRIWLTTEPLDYWPLTNSSFWLEWRLWGLYTTGYHVTNLVLHVTSGVLIWRILRRLSVPGALLAATIFVIHPVNVESVAWIAQRKNTLSMVLFLASILMYLTWEREPAERARVLAEPAARARPSQSKRRAKERSASRQSPATSVGSQPTHVSRYWLSLLLFVLAMLSKGSVAILPLILLLLMWWQYGRVTGRDLWHTAPFFVVAAVLTLVNIWFQTHYMIGASIRSVTPLQRLLGAGAVVWFYASKALLPLKLIFIYPQWTIRAEDWRWWIPIAGAALVTAALVWQRERPIGRALLFAWSVFCVALAPAMGFTDVYFMRIALVSDHYQYIAMVAVAAIVAAAIDVAAHAPSIRSKQASVLYGTMATALVVALGILTWHQASSYTDAETLYRATLAENPSSPLIHNNLGLLLIGQGTIADAREQFLESVRLNPDQVEARFNLCHASTSLGLNQEAIAECSEAADAITKTLATVPSSAALEKTRHTYGQSLALVYNDLGGTSAALGRFEAAQQAFQGAVAADPSFADAHNNLANILMANHREAEAVVQYREAIRLQPDSAPAHNNLGLAFEKLGRTSEAIQEYLEAVRLEPTLTQARGRLDALRK